MTKGDIDIDFSVRKARRSARWAEEEGLVCDTESREWAKEYGRAIDRVQAARRVQRKEGLLAAFGMTEVQGIKSQWVRTASRVKGGPIGPLAKAVLGGDTTALMPLADALIEAEHPLAQNVFELIAPKKKGRAKSKKA